MFLHRVPAPPLSDHIVILWLFEADAPGHAQERLMPSGSMELIVDLHDGRDWPAAIVGAYSEPRLLDTSRENSVVGAHFRPGGAFAFLGRPATELHNFDVTLSDLWPPAEARELRDRLLATPSAAERLVVLEQALLARLRRATARHPMVTFAIDQFRKAMPVGEVTEQLGVSQRTFITTFAREVGMTPKLYSRVRRFQRVLRMIHRREDVDWSDVALACGYFDQPHLIHDFRAFSGFTPSEYLAAHTEHLNHVPLR